MKIDSPSNQASVTYLKEVSDTPEFEYPQVFIVCPVLVGTAICKFLQEFFDHIVALWNDRGVIACFDRSNEYQLIDCAK